MALSTHNKFLVDLRKVPSVQVSHIGTRSNKVQISVVTSSEQIVEGFHTAWILSKKKICQGWGAMKLRWQQQPLVTFNVDL